MCENFDVLTVMLICLLSAIWVFSKMGQHGSLWETLSKPILIKLQGSSFSWLDREDFVDSMEQEQKGSLWSWWEESGPGKYDEERYFLVKARASYLHSSWEGFVAWI